MTEILVSITVRNNGSTAVTKMIPRGMVVELAQPNSPYQHAMVLRDYPVTIPPQSEVTIHVEAACLNRNRQWPAGASGNLTPFSFSGLSANQDDLWSQLSPLEVTE